MIPTIGRKVWFFPSEEELQAEDAVRISDQPFDATVVHVNGDGGIEGTHRINIVYFDHAGFQFSYRGVPLALPGSEEAAILARRRSYCTWMPYQVSQAAKS